MIDGCGLRDVELVEVALRVLAQRPRVVVVAVDERRLLVQRLRALEQRGVGLRCGGLESESEQGATRAKTGIRSISLDHEVGRR